MSEFAMIPVAVTLKINHKDGGWTSRLFTTPGQTTLMSTPSTTLTVPPPFTTSLRSAPLGSAPLRSAPLRSAPLEFAPVRFASLEGTHQLNIDEAQRFIDQWSANVKRMM